MEEGKGEELTFCLVDLLYSDGFRGQDGALTMSFCPVNGRFPVSFRIQNVGSLLPFSLNLSTQEQK